MGRAFTRADLANLKPAHSRFVGIDSDGCVFDTMEVKQKHCFHGIIISHWHLEPIGKLVRETAEFVNLYSRWRGSNRFPALLKVFDLLRERPEVKAAGVMPPELNALRRFIDSGAPLGNPQLQDAADGTGDPELADVLRWSLAINACIGRLADKTPPFRRVRESLERLRATADVICVSQTPAEALLREWAAHDLAGYVAVIAGQEMGTKAEHIALASKGKYPADGVLMIGDAPGDREAARANGALFYPINPGREEDSWERFLNEAYDRFLAGNYRGEYQDRLTAEFEALLPERAPWRKAVNSE